MIIETDIARFLYLGTDMIENFFVSIYLFHNLLLLYNLLLLRSTIISFTMFGFEHILFFEFMAAILDQLF